MRLVYIRIEYGSKSILHFQIDPDETIEINPDPDPKYGSVTLDTIGHNSML